VTLGKTLNQICRMPLLLLKGGLALLVLGGPGMAAADEVRVADGSVLKGEVVRHTTEALRLKTSFAGTIEIDWSEVATVILDEPVTVLFQDDSTLEVRTVAVEDDQFVFQEHPNAQPVIVPRSRIDVIEPDAWELGQGHQFTGLVNLAWERESGNSESTELDLDFNMDYRWRDNHLLSYGELEYDTTRGFRSSDNWTWFSNLDHTFEGKWYFAGAVMFKKDRFADLKLRTLAGPGLGYRFFQSKPTSTSGVPGPVFACHCWLVSSVRSNTKSIMTANLRSRPRPRTRRSISSSVMSGDWSCSVYASGKLNVTLLVVFNASQAFSVFCRAAADGVHGTSRQ